MDGFGPTQESDLGNDKTYDHSTIALICHKQIRCPNRVMQGLIHLLYDHSLGLEWF